VTAPLGHNLRRPAWVALGLGLFVMAPVRGQAVSGGNCIACHEVLGDERLSAPVQLFSDDVHADKGFGCVACHGGDDSAPGLQGMDPATGFVGKPKGRALLEVCGRCHSDAEFMRQFNPSLRVDQVTEYLTSVHGRRLVQAADTLVATCSSCHPAHQVRPPADPQSSVHPLNVAETCGSCHGDAAYMSPYAIRTDQRERYGRSVHWHMISEESDLSAPTCNDCHGNHGAAPPGLSWVGNVCGQCHTVMADFYRQSRHAETFATLGVPGCATCHQNHDIQEAEPELLGLDEGAVCARCHTAEDRGGGVAQAMRGQLDSLEAEFEAARAILERAERAGMEVSQAVFELEAAINAQVAARAAVHSFDLDAVMAEVGEGLEITAAGHAAGKQSLDELGFRRKGLAISVVIILALIVGLLLRIRQIERHP